MRNLAMLAVLAAGACGPGYDGVWSGTFKASTTYGGQRGSMELAIDGNGVSGTGANETLYESFDVGGTISDDGIARIVYTYPRSGVYTANGKVTVSDDRATGTLSMVANGRSAGTVELDLVRH